MVGFEWPNKSIVHSEHKTSVNSIHADHKPAIKKEEKSPRDSRIKTSKVELTPPPPLSQPPPPTKFLGIIIRAVILHPFPLVSLFMLARVLPRLLLLFLFILESNYVWIIHAVPKADPSSGSTASTEGNNFSFIAAQHPAQHKWETIQSVIFLFLHFIVSFTPTFSGRLVRIITHHGTTTTDSRPTSMTPCFSRFSLVLFGSPTKFEGFRGDACVGWAAKHNHQGGLLFPMPIDTPF